MTGREEIYDIYWLRDGRGDVFSLEIRKSNGRTAVVAARERGYFITGWWRCVHARVSE